MDERNSSATQAACAICSDLFDTMNSYSTTESRDRRVGVLMVILVGLAILFLGLSALHRRPRDAFELNAASFEGFNPGLDGWMLEKRPIGNDPSEPNILCYRVTPMGMTAGARSPMSLRLVHGYNVRDCMRIKGYAVEEMGSPRTAARGPEPSGFRASTSSVPGRALSPVPQHSDGQLWRMVSPAGVTSLWATAMLRADTFEATDRDVRSMPFPRAGVPDDPDWSPGGITVEGLRHPAENARKVVRAKWNASRSDWLTFLGLRRPAWVQVEWLTLVVASEGPGTDATTLKAVQSAFVAQLMAWERGRVEGEK